MKKRVVALLLSVSLCMAMVMEAGAAGFEDQAFSDAAATEVFDAASAEGPEAGLPEETQPAENAVPEEVTPLPEEVTPVPEEVTPAPEEVTPVPEFPGDEADIFTSEEEPAAEPSDEAAVLAYEEGIDAVAAVDDNTVTADNWKSVNGKWKLLKNSGKTKSAAAEASLQAAGEAAPAEVFQKAPSEEAPVQEEAVPEETAEEMQALNDTEVFEETVSEEMVPEEAVPEETGADAAVIVPEETAVEAEGAASEYFTDKDGFVEITTVVGTNRYTGKYLFDANGYMVTGQKNMTVGTPGYTLTAQKEFFFMDSANAVLNADIQAGTEATPYNSNLGQAQKSYWLWTKDTFRYYDSAYKFLSVGELKKINTKNKKYKGYYYINGYNYCLDNNGAPRTGDIRITEGIAQGQYYFQPKANANDIPGKMLRNAWNRKKTSKGDQWRWFKSDGRLLVRGITATKLDTRLMGNATYLLDASGYLIKSKMVKAENGSYYGSDKNGRVYKDKVVKFGNYRYYFTASGKRSTWKNGWYRCKGMSSRYYYFGKTAGRITEKKGWQKITVNGKMVGWFYFPSNGNHYVSTWTNTGRYFKADGKLASGKTLIGNKYYFFQISTSKAYKGKVYKKTWISYKGKWYYAGSKTGMLYRNGWAKVGSGYYYFQDDCSTKTNTFMKRNGVNGYLDSKGKHCTGWVVRSNAKNRVSYVDTEGTGFLRNTTKVIDGLKYYFDKNGYRINDVSDRVQGPYYVEVDRKNGVMTVYNKAKTIPVKSMRVSVGNPITLTRTGRFTLRRSARWQLLMGPSWGQYGTHVNGGIYVHSVACSQPNSYNLPVGEYLRLGSPASHGCIRCCVADAKWIYDNCHLAKIRIFDGKVQSNEALKGPLGRNPLTPLRGSRNFDPTDPLC